MQNKIKEVGIWGLIWGAVAYLFSLPILIWKSSNLGKIVFLGAFLTICLNFSVKAIDKGLEYYKEYLGIQYQVSQQKKYEEEYLKIQEKIGFLRQELASAESQILMIDAIMKESTKNAINTIANHLKSKINENEIDDRISLIESSLDLMQEKGRQAVKDKIIEVKEMVKVHKKSIDSVEVRKICEQIADNVKLLNEDEKARMLADLQEIGFKIKYFSDESQIIIRDSRTIATTADTIRFYSYPGERLYQYGY